MNTDWIEKCIIDKGLEKGHGCMCLLFVAFPFNEKKVPTNAFTVVCLVMFALNVVVRLRHGTCSSTTFKGRASTRAEFSLSSASCAREKMVRTMEVLQILMANCFFKKRKCFEKSECPLSLQIFCNGRMLMT